MSTGKICIRAFHRCARWSLFDTHSDAQVFKNTCYCLSQRSSTSEREFRHHVFWSLRSTKPRASRMSIDDSPVHLLERQVRPLSKSFLVLSSRRLVGVWWISGFRLASFLSLLTQVHDNESRSKLLRTAVSHKSYQALLLTTLDLKCHCVVATSEAADR